MNKENCIVIETINKETISFKSEKILKEANNKIRGWIEGGKKKMNKIQKQIRHS